MLRQNLTLSRRNKNCHQARSTKPIRAIRAMFAFLWVSVFIFAAYPATSEAKTGLPVPRFVSLKSGSVNVRQGPSRNHDVIFTFKKSGLPVEITAEFDNWRKIRDSEGEEGWVWHSLLSNRRTALTTPWDNDLKTSVYKQATETSPIIAYAEGSVVVSIKNCDTKWCAITADNITGFVLQETLWGVYPNEAILE